MPDNERPIDSSEKNEKFSVFISHINENKNIANKLKGFILENFPENVEVFIAGDPDNIAFSEDWFTGIKEGIKDCNLMVLLCTPESVRRPWINFEAGAATLLDKNVGPICFAGQKVGQLPSPLNYIRSQAIDCLDDENFEQHFNKFMEIIAKKIGISTPVTNVLDSDFYHTLKSEKPIQPSKKSKTENLTQGDYDPSNPDLKRVIKHIGQTIFTPMKGMITNDCTFFLRGYNIESYFRQHPNKNKNPYNLENTPNELIKKLIYDPDPILQKYIEEIKELCDEYDSYLERLEIINKDIFDKTNIIWDDFVKLCDNLNSPSDNPLNEWDYIILLSLAIADSKPLEKSYQMGEFFEANKDALRAFILNSPLEKNVRAYSTLRKDYFSFSDRFLKILTSLLNEWLRTYYLIESDLQQQFSARMI